MIEKKREIIQANIEFLKRCSLQGQEVPAFNAVMSELQRQLYELDGESELEK